MRPAEPQRLHKSGEESYSEMVDKSLASLIEKRHSVCLTADKSSRSGLRLRDGFVRSHDGPPVGKDMLTYWLVSTSKKISVFVGIAEVPSAEVDFRGRPRKAVDFLRFSCAAH